MDESYPVSKIRCSYEDCSESLKGDSWSRIKSNWFFQKNGQNWCPNHTPEWVTEWRERKKRDRNANS